MTALQDAALLEAATMTSLSAALFYASPGWPVLPSDPTNKKPLIAGGVHSATTDADTICAWWSKWPDAIIGIVAGSRSSLVVFELDVDRERWVDGVSEFQRLNGGG